MLFSPTEHAANPPSTWQVVKVGPRQWRVYPRQYSLDDGAIEYCKTKREAEAVKLRGRAVDLYEKEGRWYAGLPVAGWKPFSQSHWAKIAVPTGASAAQ
jgi:hypothetical protein